ncbi:MAG: universal stress protein [Myxococcales bacterium]|nr:universal stress protein [Myxococcales bacterium]MCB9706647.1 universal stress protein [Myxococcales bacterium]
MEVPPRWLVGLDLLPQNTGVLRVAAWLRSGSPVGEVIGVHVVETGVFRFVGERISTILDAARATMDEALLDAGATGSFHLLEAVAATSAERGLEDAALRHQATALVVGRWSRRGERSLVKLGRVARRLLRSLAAPVIVTPPDLLRSDIGDGPMLVATDLTEASVEACRFAATLASRYGRRLLVAHVAAPIEHASIYVLDHDWEVLREQERRLVEERVAAWVAEHVPGEPEVTISYGAIVDELIALTEQVRAPMIVTGTRRLGLSERLFGSSTASTLAGIAPCPIAVVPSKHGS